MAKDIYVDPDAGGAGTGADWANAYTSLQAAETAEQADITGLGVYTFHCKSSSGSVDTAATFDDWTTTSSDYIKIQGGYAAGEAGTPGTPDSLTEYSSSYYRIEDTDTNHLSLKADFMVVDKIQVGLTLTAGSAHAIIAAGVVAGATHTISNCICKGVSIVGTGASIGIYSIDADVSTTIYNCIIYGFVSGADTGFRGISLIGDMTIYNSTVYGCGRGIHESGSATYNAQNCLSFDNGLGDVVGTWTSVTYCATDDSVAGTGNFQITQSASNYAALVTDAPNGDFSTTNGASELFMRGNGTTPKSIFTTDIAGTTRGPNDSSWDIGAFELDLTPFAASSLSSGMDLDL